MSTFSKRLGGGARSSSQKAKRNRLREQDHRMEQQELCSGRSDLGGNKIIHF